MRECAEGGRRLAHVMKRPQHQGSVTDGTVRSNRTTQGCSKE
jgi:hypothetical protein